MHWTDQQNPNATSNFQTVNSLDEFPQPFSGSVCTLMEFNTYLSNQISKNFVIESKGYFSFNNKFKLYIEIDKKGEITVLMDNTDHIKITIPKFETPAFINSSPVNVEYTIPIHICIK